jgi:FSR family fosmidomycin resistance protein-like MFS transporter
LDKTGPTAAAELNGNAKSSSRASALVNPWFVLALLASAHFLVDIVAGTTSPLWPTLEENLLLNTGGLLWVYVCWSIATSFGQLFFGIWADRRPLPWLIWAGPLLAILCLSCIGVATSQYALCVLFVIGGLGIAAFHPEAAATAGSLVPERRSRMMAIFALCGYLGQSAGPYYSGIITDHLGTRGLMWGIAWGLPILFALWIGLRRVPGEASTKQPVSVERTPVRLPFRLLVLLLAVGSFRILPALGVPLALAYLLKATSTSSAVIGAVQSAFMGGIGIGAMGCAAFLRQRWERTALWVFPLMATPLLATLSLASGWTLALQVGACGLLLGVTMPVYISYGQQLLPHGQRVASSITMGVSWGIAGAIVAAAMWTFKSADSLSSIFYFFAATSLTSSFLCHLLPVPEQSNRAGD